MTPAMDVVIVSYNTREDLADAIASLFAHPPSALGIVFVVDNASGDGSAAMVRERWPSVHVEALEANVGFAAANNLALRQASAPLVLLLNSDTVVAPGALDVLRDRMLARGAVAAGPRLNDGSGRPEVSFGPMLSPWAELRQQRLVRLAAQDEPSAQRTIERHLADEREVDWVSGACLLVDRGAALDAGLFDERFFLYEEDVDFCAALRARGGRVLFTPAAAITHRRGRSRAATGNRSPALYDRSHLAFYEKHRPGWAPLLRLWLRLRGRRIR